MGQRHVFGQQITTLAITPPTFRALPATRDDQRPCLTNEIQTINRILIIDSSNMRQQRVKEKKKGMKHQPAPNVRRHLLHITIPHLGNAIFPPKTFGDNSSGGVS